MLEEYEKKRGEKAKQWEEKVKKFCDLQKVVSVDPEIVRKKELEETRKRQE
jgi:hypothetical protein